MSVEFLNKDVESLAYEELEAKLVDTERQLAQVTEIAQSYAKSHKALVTKLGAIALLLAAPNVELP